MRSVRQKIVVMGLGYIGLPTASMLATKGYEVVGVDISETIVNTINSGDIHIVEPDLDILVRSAVNSRSLRASLVPEEADIFIIAVPTPFKKNNDNPKAPDISYVEAATRTLAPYLRPDNLVILESTSPVGTTERIKEIFAETRPDLFTHGDVLPIYIAHCPERVLPGHIIRELVDNDRIIGGVNEASAKKARNLYLSFCNGNIQLTDSKTAEMAKLVENSYRDVNIAFANELSVICDKLSINVWELISLANLHPRVNILQPGPGVGGHCIAVDPWFVVASAPQEACLIRTAREVNDRKPHWVIEKVKHVVSKWRDDRGSNGSRQPIIGCLGLAFKANIDDVRESPALEIINELKKCNIGSLMVCEPNIDNSYGDIELHFLDEVLADSDILLILVDHKEFIDVDYNNYSGYIIDTKGITGITYLR